LHLIILVVTLLSNWPSLLNFSVLNYANNYTRKASATLAKSRFYANLFVSKTDHNLVADILVNLKNLIHLITTLIAILLI